VFGHKDRAFSLYHPPTTYRILALGDSYTEGVGVALHETFAAMLERRMNARLRTTHPELSVEVYNLGHSGRNTHEEIDLLLYESPLLTPDMVLLSYVLNDAEQHPDPLTTDLKPFWLQWTTLNDFFFFRVRSYAFYWFFTRSSRRIDGIQLSVAQHDVDYAGWKQVEQSLEQYRHYLEQTPVGDLAILFPLLVAGEYPPQLDSVHQQIVQAFEARDLAIIDLLPAFQAQGKSLDECKFSADDGHPDRETHAMIGNLLADAVFTSEHFQHFLDRNADDSAHFSEIPDAPLGSQFRNDIKRALELARQNEQTAALTFVNQVIGNFEQAVAPQDGTFVSAWTLAEYRDYARTHQYETVAWVDGAYSEAYLLKAQLLLADGDVEGAFSNLERIRTIAPCNSSVYAMRGALLQRLNKLPEALFQYQNAYVCAMRHEYQQANIPVILQSMGAIYQQRGNNLFAQVAYFESTKYQQIP
jgi:lysophospholipase L1-like esterase